MSIRKGKSKRGHLIIHDLTLKEADEIMESLKGTFPQKSADWWPSEEIDQFDTAALIAVGKEPRKFHSLRNGKHYKESS